MKKEIRTGLLLGLVLLSEKAFTQNVINASSYSAQMEGMLFDYSIGEMSLVSTNHSSDLIITQGFLQHEIARHSRSNSSDQPWLNSLSQCIKVFPNPTSNLLHLEFMNLESYPIDMRLIDIAGKVVLLPTVEQIKSPSKTSLDLTTLSAGTYFLVIQCQNEALEEETISYKIQKTK